MHGNTVTYLMLGAGVLFILVCLVMAALTAGSRYDDAHGYDQDGA